MSISTKSTGRDGHEKRQIAVIGGRGNGTVLAGLIRDCEDAGQSVTFAGFIVDDPGSVPGHRTLGPVARETIQQLNDFYFIFSLSNVKQAPDRFRILEDLAIPRDRYMSLIHPTATVDASASLGCGIALMPGVVVGPDTRIGDHSQMYAQSFLGHDSSLDEMVFVANNASIGGRVSVHRGAHIGSNSSVIERITISEFAVVGLGSVVLKSVRPYEKVAGNPAKSIGFLPDP